MVVEAEQGGVVVLEEKHHGGGPGCRQGYPNHEQHGSLVPFVRALGDDGIAALAGCGKRHACVDDSVEWPATGVGVAGPGYAAADDGADGYVRMLAAAARWMDACERTLVLGQATHIIGLFSRSLELAGRPVG